MTKGSMIPRPAGFALAVFMAFALCVGEAQAVQSFGITFIKEANVPPLTVPLGALQVDVDYSGASGTFEGTSEGVACARDATLAGLVAFNDDDATQTLFLGFADDDGYANVQVLATCVFEKSDGAPAPSPGDFDVTVSLAGNLDLELVTVSVEIAGIETCQCDDGSITCLEECDDSNTIGGDGCSATCQCENACGDGNLEAPCEQCDPGGLCQFGGEPPGTFCTFPAGPECTQGGICLFNEGAGCDIDCQLDGVCGDGVLQPATEQCDDGNASNLDGCLNDCTLAFCGDGFTRTGVEECDDANAANDDACLNDCAAASCGDGFVRTGVEECDDGNVDDGDCCSGACLIETTPQCQPVACGDADENGGINATDSLAVLQTAVGSGSCQSCVCDVDQSSPGIVATDALVVLQFGVGQPVTLDCPPCL